MALKDADRDRMLKSAQELHDMIAAIDSDVVVNLTFGPRKFAGVDARPGGEFNKSWNDAGHFAMAFAKDGDGFANMWY